MKKWKKVLLHVLTVLLVMAGVCGYFLFLYPHEQDFVESYYKVQSDKLTSHLRIVQLSDLHLRHFGFEQRRIRLGRSPHLHHSLFPPGRRKQPGLSPQYPDPQQPYSHL